MEVVTEETKIPTPMELVESIRQLQRVDWDQATDSFAGITCRLIDKNYKNDNNSALAILKTINEKTREEHPNPESVPPSIKAILIYSLQIELYD